MYTKLFQSIVTSSLWSEDSDTCKTWVTLLAMADKNGEVLATVPGLARICALPIPAVEAAIAKFEAPDAYSRTKDDEGRRVQPIEGGWLILNHAKYRDMASREDQKRQNAERQRRFRERQARNGKSVTDNESEEKCNAEVTQTLHIAEAEAEAESYSGAEPESKNQGKPARLSSETCDVPPSTDLPEEGRQAGNPEFSEKDSKAPMTEAAWLNLAGKMGIETAFAVALYAEMDAKGWIDNDGKPVAFLAQFLRASWQRERARRDQSATKPTNGKREPWMIEVDIKRVKAEISRIQNDKANFNHGGRGPSLESHKAKFEDAWLAELRALREEVRRQLPAEYAAFEREHVEHVAAMLKDGVPASTMDDDYALSRLAERMPEELPSFERWDREWNRTNAWKDPAKLNPEARQMVKQLRGHLEKLENELRAVMKPVS